MSELALVDSRGAVFAYYSRWITARRLARMRVIDPQWVERHERWASIAGFNMQLDETGR